MCVCAEDRITEEHLESKRTNNTYKEPPAKQRSEPGSEDVCEVLIALLLVHSDKVRFFLWQIGNKVVVVVVVVCSGGMCVRERERRKARDFATKTKHGLQVTSYYI